MSTYSSSYGPLTPTSSACDSIGNWRGATDGDTPVESIEHDFASPKVQELALVVSPPPDANIGSSSGERLEHQMGQLTLTQTPQTSRCASLSPRPVPGRRRSSTSASKAPRHEVDQEDLPDSIFYHGEFQDALVQSRSLAQRLATALSVSSSNLHAQESGIKDLYEQALAISQDPGPEKWRIGLVGDSGSGKSSLINSLLDHPHLARSSNSTGKACTCAVTEFHYHQASNFVVAINYFSVNEMIQQFAELLDDYRQFHDPESKGISNTLENDVDLKKAASVAWETFHGAFRDQPSLYKSFLLRESSQCVVEQFRLWMSQSAPYPDGGTQTQVVEGAAQCSAILRDVSSEAADTSAVAKWPYIKTITVSLRALVLSKGLILVDLPGLRDTNSARQAITENYITRHCNEVFAVTSISRATTNVSIDDVLHLAQSTTASYRPLQVSIVCTSSDVINAEEAKNDWKGMERKTLQRIMSWLQTLRETIQGIDDDIDDMSNEQAGELVRHQKRLQKNLNEAEYQQRKFLTETRNGIVSMELKRKYEGKVRKIFCVSNKLYTNNRKGNQSAATALPWLHLSGIISLRKHCIGLVADHQLQHARTYIKERVPHLVSSIDLWVQSGSSSVTSATRTQIRDASKEVERILDEALGHRLSPCNRISVPLNGKCDNAIRLYFKTDGNSTWSDIAIDAAEKWSEWNPSSYRAFCNKYGDHQTPSIGRACWNAEIISEMASDLKMPWNRMRTSVAKIFRAQLVDIERCIDLSMKPIQNIEVDPVSAHENGETVEMLLQTMLGQKTLLLTQIQKITAQYRRELLELVTVDFLSPIRSSFIGQEMEATYRASIREYGTGSDRRRKHLINAKVADPNIFHNLYLRFDESFRNLTADVEKKIRHANRDYLRAVRAALDTLRTVNVLHEAEQDPAFRDAVRKEVANAREVLEGIAAATRPFLGSGVVVGYDG